MNKDVNILPEGARFKPDLLDFLRGNNNHKPLKIMVAKFKRSRNRT